jgi:hypothetical protein
MSFNWKEIREKGKAQFVLVYGLILSVPLVFDYYLIKFFVTSFRLRFSLTELLFVWMICLLVGFIFFLSTWKTMEKMWKKNNSLFK